MSKLWICGEYISGNEPDGVIWGFSGVFDTEEKAIVACINENYFVAPIELNAIGLVGQEPFPACYYPLSPYPVA